MIHRSLLAVLVHRARWTWWQSWWRLIDRRPLLVLRLAIVLIVLDTPRRCIILTRGHIEGWRLGGFGAVVRKRLRVDGGDRRLRGGRLVLLTILILLRRWRLLLLLREARITPSCSTWRSLPGRRRVARAHRSGERCAWPVRGPRYGDLKMQQRLSGRMRAQSHRPQSLTTRQLTTTVTAMCPSRKADDNLSCSGSRLACYKGERGRGSRLVNATRGRLQ